MGDRRKSLSCAAVEGPLRNRFVTELTSGSASRTRRQGAPLPRRKQGVLCCDRSWRGGGGGGGPLPPPPPPPPPPPRDGQGKGGEKARGAGGGGWGEGE